MNVHVKVNPANQRRDEILRLADAIEGVYRFQFDMRAWSTCIAGLCAKMYGDYRGGDSSQDFATTFLGLDYNQANVMFTPKPDELGFEVPLGGDRNRRECEHMMEVTAPWAANMLRFYAFTGKIDWKGTRPDSKTMAELAGVIDALRTTPLPAGERITIAVLPPLTAGRFKDDDVLPITTIEIRELVLS